MGVLREFQPSGNSPDQNGNFIMYAASVEIAMRKGTFRSSNQHESFGKGCNVPQIGWSAQGKGGKGCSTPTGSTGIPTADELQSFIDTWGLDGGSVSKIQGMPPEALRVIIRDFWAEGNSSDWNAKFIEYCLSLKNAIMSGTFVDQGGLSEMELQQHAGVVAEVAG